jgi:hypothetical protein
MTSWYLLVWWDIYAGAAGSPPSSWCLGLNREICASLFYTTRFAQPQIGAINAKPKLPKSPAAYQTETSIRAYEVI